MSHPPPFLENIPLKDHCTFGIGGPACYFLEVHSIADMQEAIKWCRINNIPFMVLGKGSNCLFDDRGFKGAILQNKIDFCEEKSPGIFHVGSGYSFALLGVQTARKGWGGLEFASGIPASVGGAVYMNAGANGGETAQCLESIDFVNEKGDLELLNRNQLIFSYRHSPFQARRGAIVGATFVLKPNPEARKKQIEIVNARTKTQPYGSMSAGCVFLNPTCCSAGAIIDKCGLKGLRVGDALVSELHANFLINENAATCQDMLALIKLVQTRVKEQMNVDLQSEVRQIPYDLGIT